MSDVDALAGPDRQAAAYRFFLSRGWSPAQAAGIVGGLNGETSNLNTAQRHDGGIGLGIAGWNGPRLHALQQYAATNGASPTSLPVQLGFVDHELRSTEGAAGAALGRAQTPEDAGNAMLGYLRPHNYNVPGAHPERAQYARQVFNAFSGGQGMPQPAATVAAAAPQPAASVAGAFQRALPLMNVASAQQPSIINTQPKQTAAQAPIPTSHVPPPITPNPVPQAPDLPNFAGDLAAIVQPRSPVADTFSRLYTQPLLG